MRRSITASPSASSRNEATCSALMAPETAPEMAPETAPVGPSHVGSAELIGDSCRDGDKCGAEAPAAEGEERATALWPRVLGASQWILTRRSAASVSADRVTGKASASFEPPLPSNAASASMLARASADGASASARSHAPRAHNARTTSPSERVVASKSRALEAPLPSATSKLSSEARLALRSASS